MNYADIKVADIANGEGVRVSLFVSGCNHKCKGCFNSVAWDFNYGNTFDNEAKQKIFDELDKDYVEGLSLLGGEPLELQNVKGLIPLVKEVKQKYPNKNIWCYTGFTFEKDLLNNPEIVELLSYVDVLVDGKFEQENYKPNLRFRGSTNQRIIDVKQSLNSKVTKFFEF